MGCCLRSGRYVLRAGGGRRGQRGRIGDALPANQPRSRTCCTPHKDCTPARHTHRRRPRASGAASAPEPGPALIIADAPNRAATNPHPLPSLLSSQNCKHAPTIPPSFFSDRSIISATAPPWLKPPTTTRSLGMPAATSAATRDSTKLRASVGAGRPGVGAPQAGLFSRQMACWALSP
jgi:hypothetical protein